MNAISPTLTSPYRRKRQKSRSVFCQIGNTPLLELSSYSPNGNVKLFAKLEWQNPGRSVKDRAASRIIRSALKSGALNPDKILLDSSSGNTGLAYAMLGAAVGIRVKLAVPENVSDYQKNLLKAYGAEVIWTPAAESSDGAIRTARAIYAESPDRYYFADQYSNAANWRAHYHTTAREIWKQTKGRITHFVAGLGTSGTFIGTGRRLREYNNQIRLCSFQPDSPLHGLEGLKHMPTAIVPAIYDYKLADQNLEVDTESAYDLVRHLARKNGVLAGLSSGAALAAARKVASKIKSGLVVTIFPDGGQRYLDEPFWNEEENGNHLES